MIDRVTRSCLWSRLLKSGYGWKVNVFLHFCNMRIQCKYNIHMLFLTFIYTWFLCGYHVIHNIYIYIFYVYIYIFIFLCRLLLVSHIYLFQVDTRQGGLFGPNLRAEYLDHGLVRTMGTVVTDLVGLWGNASRTTCNIMQKALSTKWEGRRIGRWITRHSKSNVYTYVFELYILYLLIYHILL